MISQNRAELTNDELLFRKNDGLNRHGASHYILIKAKIKDK